MLQEDVYNWIVYNMKKISCVLYLLGRIIQYKLTNQSEGYWEWLSDKLRYMDKNTLRAKCIVRFLFLDAYDRNYNLGICYIYEHYMSVLSEKKMPAKYYITIFNISLQDYNQYLANNILNVVREDPNYFPLEFRNSYEKLFSERFDD